MQNNRWVAIVLLIVLFVLLLFRLEQCDREDSATINGLAIKQLEAENDSLSKANQQLSDKVKAWQHKADSLEKQAALNKTEIKRFIRQRDERLKNIDNLNSNELYRFFSGLSAGQDDIKADSTTGR